LRFIIGKTDCQLELLEPTRGTTLLAYYPAGTVTTKSMGFQMDSNSLVAAIGKQLKGEGGASAGVGDAEDTGFRYGNS